MGIANAPPILRRNRDAARYRELDSQPIISGEDFMREQAIKDKTAIAGIGWTAFTRKSGDRFDGWQDRHRHRPPLIHHCAPG